MMFQTCPRMLRHGICAESENPESHFDPFLLHVLWIPVDVCKLCDD